MLHSYLVSSNRPRRCAAPLRFPRKATARGEPRYAFQQIDDKFTNIVRSLRPTSQIYRIKRRRLLVSYGLISVTWNCVFHFRTNALSGVKKIEFGWADLLKIRTSRSEGYVEIRLETVPPCLFQRSFWALLRRSSRSRDSRAPTESLQCSLKIDGCRPPARQFLQSMGEQSSVNFIKISYCSVHSAGPIR